MKPRAGDFVIGILILFLAVGIWIYPRFVSEKGKVCRISVDGKVCGELSLSEDGELKLPGCTVKVTNGEVFVVDSTCPDKVCEKTGRISKSGESIICVPNRVSVEITGECETDIIAG